MSSPNVISFLKMNGLGNDFVVFDARHNPLTISAEAAGNIANREHGIGCDQVIVMEPSDKADVFMRIFNADGSEVDACGNATRCVARLIGDELQSANVSIETNAGVLNASIRADGMVTVNMGTPNFHWEAIPLAEEFRDTRGIELQIGPIDDPVLHTPSAVNVGNPHAIFWVDDASAHDLHRFGPILENHPIFPERANISLAQITTPSSLILRTWERGAGLTKACGTAACAAAVCAARKKLTGRIVQVSVPAGLLKIEWRETDDCILMTGPVELEYRGELDASSFSLLAA